jgi:thymidylate synthase
MKAMSQRYSNGETSYLDMLQRCVHHGDRKENRTGIDTFVLPPQFFVHDMRAGFPLLTTKRMAKRTCMVELEGFIGGITDKRWYQERGCKIWDEWSNKTTRPEGVSQEEWHDLGPIYGYQWRRFNHQTADNMVCSSAFGPADNSVSDQLATIVRSLHENPNDRRMVCSAWNPQQHESMALPPCHVLWNVTHINGTLNLHWHQRSCDMFIGVPFNIASYAMLLQLLCREARMTPGQLSGTLCDCHVYENHLDQVNEQISRKPRDLPRVSTGFGPDGIFGWTHKDVKWIGYDPHPPIKAPIAV